MWKRQPAADGSRASLKLILLCSLSYGCSRTYIVFENDLQFYSDLSGVLCGGVGRNSLQGIRIAQVFPSVPGQSALAMLSLVVLLSLPRTSLAAALWSRISRSKRPCVAPSRMRFDSSTRAYARGVLTAGAHVTAATRVVCQPTWPPTARRWPKPDNSNPQESPRVFEIPISWSWTCTASKWVTKPGRQPRAAGLPGVLREGCGRPQATPSGCWHLFELLRVGSRWLVAVFAQPHFSAEGPIDHSGIAKHEGHADQRDYGHDLQGLL